MLSPGSSIGAYRIVAHIGSGGMGDVYRALDPRLGRDVAIKVLREPSDPERLRRFEQEARTASALNHPSVVHVYDVGRHEGVPFIAMEYVAGERLREVLAEAPLASRRILSLGAQIADGLAKAHAAGIVHRDLKPENVVVTPDGRAKILDFGIAKLAAREPPAVSESAPTLGVTTRSGVVPGTVGYMSPEQVSGRDVDFRSDQFCLGLILYEMATGRRAFHRDSAPETLAAILRDEPEPLARLNPSLPAPLKWVIERCLAKDPADRYASTEDLARELRALHERFFELVASSEGIGIAGAGAGRRRRGRGAAAVGALLLAAGLAAWLARDRFFRPAPVADYRLELLVSPEGQAFDPDLSPDGKRIAYVAEDDGRFDLFVGRVAGGARVRLTNDEAREADPDFSPDGERILFTRTRPDGTSELCVLPALGGEVVPVVEGAAMGAWSADGRSLAFVSETPGEGLALGVASSTGRDRRTLLRSDDRYIGLFDPAWSPDGASIVVRRSMGGLSGELWLVPVAGGPPRRLSDDPPGVFSHSPIFDPAGRGIIHSSNRAGATNLWIWPLDGGAVRRLTTGPGPDTYPSAAADGSIAFVSSRWQTYLFVHDLGTGTSRELVRHSQILWGPAFSPDGRTIAFSRSEADGSWHIWSVDLATGSVRRLTSGELPEVYPRFFPDGAALIYFTWVGEGGAIWSVPRSGAAPRRLTSGDEDAYGDVSPDGRRLAFARTEAGTVRVYVAGVDGGDAVPLLDPPSTLPRWSPDGRTIAFTRDRGYGGGIFLARADGGGVRRLSERGGWPVWWPDGRRIGYLVVDADGSQRICVDPVEGGDCETTLALRFEGTNFPFDVSPDGGFLAATNSRHLADEIWRLAPVRP